MDVECCFDELCVDQGGWEQVWCCFFEYGCEFFVCEGVVVVVECGYCVYYVGVFGGVQFVGYCFQEVVVQGGFFQVVEGMYCE